MKFSKKLTLFLFIGIGYPQAFIFTAGSMVSLSAGARTAQRATVTRKAKASEQKSPKDVLDSKAAKILFKRQGQRMDRIKKLKYAGRIGEKDNGLIAIRSVKGLNQSQKKELLKLVKSENKDRKTLYSLIIKSNNYDDKMAKSLRRNMFESYFRLEQVGSYYQMNGHWRKK
jgi:uncharacterized protein YdbL (DUF1318 family)